MLIDRIDSSYYLLDMQLNLDALREKQVPNTDSSTLII
jgi:hypothetical protein